MNSRYKWLIDAGHGGVKDGHYVTAPGKMFIFPDGFTFYEGVNNRAIAKKLIVLLAASDIEHAVVYDEQEDTPLGVRVNRANTMHAKDPHCVYFSIHSDAMPEGSHGVAGGVAIYTSPGVTRSDKLSAIFAKQYMASLKAFKFRQGGTGDDNLDKEEKFYVLVNTAMPAMLSEFGFYDNRKEAEYLKSEAGQNDIAAAIYAGIWKCEHMEAKL
jgi:N-acetylmuramoyl-L-alanine amidase